MRADACAAWEAGLRAVLPEECVRRALAARMDLIGAQCPDLVLAVGKAGAGMLRGARLVLGDATPAIVLLPDGVDAANLGAHTLVLRGGHPYPTAEGLLATERILSEVSGLAAHQRLLVLLSGGASALLEAPVAGLASDDLVATHRLLVGSGLPIVSINLVRGCLSAVKAGGLARIAAPAEVTTLAVSDVEGDDPSAIGSGPTVVPAASYAERCRLAETRVRQAGLVLPDAARRILETGARGAGASEPTPESADYTVVASIADAVAAAESELISLGYRLSSPIPLGTTRRYLCGDTAQACAWIVDSLGQDGVAPPAEGVGTPVASVYGGETTVTITSPAPGRGGRNLDLASRLALSLRGRADVVAVVGGTDGCDGSSKAAGACIDGDTAARAEHLGLPLGPAVSAFHTEPALEAAGDLLVTGPTGTNVGDLVVVLSCRTPIAAA